MTDLDKGYPGAGGQEPHPEVRSMPFFPGPPGPPPGSTPGGGLPLGAPTLAPPPQIPHQAGRSGSDAEGTRPLRDEFGPPDGPGRLGGPGGGAVQGRITIEDEVIEKIATLAALEVAGVAGLGGRAEPGGADPDPYGRPGVRVLMHDSEVSLELLVAVEYGSVVMDVAKVVRTNVARVIGLMLGMRVAAVDVAVEDVRMPGAGAP
ncbi:Asp23/Gls24 family envelope stress response protein [Actinomadura parmotrematis]|uniref:Asp23/Gls24 family envelope stress response protein n=1 Tax=Actinomadura parmotrematis TaxID=2864039 RepID=A0ABS7G1F4_9ACTN|nr:Asp23/Gls24 family envelope stress response protein [Actinomadura parmotrematis]MBW8486513.1 Asp23/Gls24 family envelope stress response protein [Actinomadura parmotrematis]